MGVSFSLEYYDRIFGSRTVAYVEVLTALSKELVDYATALPVALANGDTLEVSRLRHSHRPLVDNLGLTQLRTLEDAIKAALEHESPGLAGLGTLLRDEALAVAQALTLERFPDGSAPRPPFPGD